MDSVANLTDLIVQRLDRNAADILEHQTAEGSFLRPDLFTDTRYTGFCVAQLITAFKDQDSRYGGNAEVKTAIRKALVYLRESRRPSGMFDLSSCNFDSAPDTAFTLNALLDAYRLLDEEDTELAHPLRELISRACFGICEGGFHTPNHRWAIAACLMTAAQLCLDGEQTFRDTAQIYLREGLDQNADGEFAERSAGTYNLVNDDQMVRLFLATGDETYLQAACRNLRMMAAYMEPDGTVYTLNSRRQDRGHRVYPGAYALQYLLVGYLAKDTEMAAQGRALWNTAVRPGDVPSVIVWFRRFPEMETFGCDTVAGDPFFHYARCFPDSGIARFRDGKMSVTVKSGDPDFLYVRCGDLDLCMSLYGNVCDRRNFTAEALEPLDADEIRLLCRMPSWYYLPYSPGEQPGTTDWWQMESEKTRRRQVRDALEMEIRIKVDLEGHGIDVHMQATGLTRVPLRMEIGLSEGELRGDSFRMRSAPGGEMVVSAGSLQLTKGSDVLTLAPCHAEHAVLDRMGGAFPRDEGRFTVYLTFISPCEHVLHIGTERIFPMGIA